MGQDGQGIPAFYTGNSVQAGKNEARGVPQLIGEVAAGLKLGLAQPQVVARRRTHGQGKAQGVGAVLLHQHQGVQDVALGLAHLGPLSISNQTVEIYGVEGLASRVLQAHHNHPGHPEEKDVVAGFHDAGGIEVVHVGCDIGPSQGGVGPQARAEPGVQHVGVLLEIAGSAAGTLRRVLHRSALAAAPPAVPDGNAVAPP